MADDNGISGKMNITVNKEAKHVTQGASKKVELKTISNAPHREKEQKTISHDFTNELRDKLGRKDG